MFIIESFFKIISTPFKVIGRVISFVFNSITSLFEKKEAVIGCAEKAVNLARTVRAAVVELKNLAVEHPVKTAGAVVSVTATINEFTPFMTERVRELAKRKLTDAYDADITSRLEYVGPTAQISSKNAKFEATGEVATGKAAEKKPVVTKPVEKADDDEVVGDCYEKSLSALKTVPNDPLKSSFCAAKSWTDEEPLDMTGILMDVINESCAVSKAAKELGGVERETVVDSRSFTTSTKMVHDTPPCSEGPYRIAKFFGEEAIRAEHRPGAFKDKRDGFTELMNRPITCNLYY